MALILSLLLLQEVSCPQHAKDVLPDMFPRSPEVSIPSIANRIGRSAEYLLLDKHNSLRYIVFTFPATIAYIAMDKKSPQARYLPDVCARNAASGGFSFGDFVLQIPTPLSTWVDVYIERYQHQTSYSSSDRSPDTLVDET